MKIIKNAVGLLLSLLCVSCTSEDVTFGVADLSNGLDETMETKFFSNRYYLNDKNILVFKSIEDCNFMLDSLSKLDDRDFKLWEQSIGFNSYRSITFDLYENTDDVESLLTEYPDLFIYNADYDLIEPQIKSKYLSSILNIDGEFYIGDKLNSGLDQSEELYSTKATDIIGNIIEYPAISYMDKKNERVMTWFRIYKQRISSSTSLSYSKIIEITVRPRALGLGGWKDVKTHCSIDEFKIHMKNIGPHSFYNEYGVWTSAIDELMSLKTFGSSSAVKRYTLSITLQSGLTDDGTLIDPYCVHYRARTYKLGKWGAAYNTYHPAGGMPDKCLHRQVGACQTEIFDK